MKLKFSELKIILELLKDLPKEDYNNGLIEEICATPGYSYHGPFGKKENKIGVGLYLTPNVEILTKDFVNANNWFYYSAEPQYHINSFISCNEKYLLELCSKYCEVLDYDFSNDNHCWIKAITTDESSYEFNNDNKIVLLYKLYAALINNSIILTSPSLSDLENVVDVNKIYQGEPTIVFKDFPLYLREEPFKRYFDYDHKKEMQNEINLMRNPGNENNKALYCLGKLKLIEGDFWILMQERSYPYPGMDLSSTNNSGHHSKKLFNLGGLIKRII